MKNILMVLAMLLTVGAKAQFNDDDPKSYTIFGGGLGVSNSKYAVYPTANIDLGRVIGRWYVSVRPMVSLKELTYASFDLPINLGRKFMIADHIVQPFISYCYSTVGAEEYYYLRHTEYAVRDGFVPGGGVCYSLNNRQIEIIAQVQGRVYNANVIFYVPFQKTR